MCNFWQHRKNGIYLQYFKENALKVRVEVFIMAVNDSSATESADTCVHIVAQMKAGNIAIKNKPT